MVTEALARKMATGAASPREGQLEAITQAASALRDAEREKQDVEERLRDVNLKIQELRHKTLPDLMHEAGVDRLGLPASGNLPPCDAKLAPYYHANIAADWLPERREAAFDWLEKNGHGDLLKVTVSVTFGKREMPQARKLAATLEGMGLAPQVIPSVPWSTLTAWLREQVEKYRSQPPLDTIGGTVGSVVKLTPRKE
jgi:hypothetical protein